MDYQDIKTLVNMRKLLECYGVTLDKGGRSKCPIHGGDNKTAFSVSSDSQTWNCHTKCDCGGDVFTFIEKKEGIGNAEAKLWIMDQFGLTEDEKPVEVKAKPIETSRVSYIYNDKDGNELYRVNRVDFNDGSKQCYQQCNGKNTLPPEVRTLYNYDKVYGCTELVYLCEGEKTADQLTACGYTATTNPLGSKSWDDSYAKLLEGIRVVVMPDADVHGEEWRDKVLKTIEGLVETAQVVTVPDKFVAKHTEYTGHDFADMVEAYGSEKCVEWLDGEVAKAKVLVNGLDLSLLGRPRDGFRELQRKAKAGVRTDVFNFNRWLPSLDLVVNQGDLVVLMAGTGVGKTRVLHNLPYHIKDINYAMFDLELSFPTLCERYGAMANGISVRGFKERMINGFGLVEPDVDNVFIQKIEKLTVAKIIERVDRIEQLSQKKVDAVGVDYIGLMGGGGSAYEKTSTNVEEFKAYISDTNRVGLLTTQIARPSDKEDGMYDCPSPFAAKNSGSIENSAQELLAFWKPSDDKRHMSCRCWKYTHGEYPSHDIQLIADDLMIQERV